MSNRLALEDSPYLQQHKNNPIDWYPWCDEAFKKAKDENKPIFISIGYSSCHWCHVMEKEVFESEDVASFVNNHFVCIKVDKEERPDIDKYYQEVYQMLNRRPGGWPTSIFATPENKPFFAGTYIPPVSRENMLGFTELTTIIAEKVAQKDAQIFNNADEIVGYLQQTNTPTQATKLTADIAKSFFKQAQFNYQKHSGGFSVSPKFPHTSTLNFLLDIYLTQTLPEAKEMVIHTLKQMQLGGMYDLVEGGFCRYSVDEKWLVPHFEKMTYDNGLLCQLYTRAFTHFQEPSFLTTAKESADFMLQSMQEDNLFYSASDADTEGEEGKYFIYNPQEVTTALQTKGYDDVKIKEILSTLDITQEGNFEGQSIVRLESEHRETWFDDVKAVLVAIRETRVAPFIDKKIQVSWNAMMIKALFMLGSIESHYLKSAQAHLDALLNTMLLEGQLYHSTLIHKEPKVKAFLEDYAYLGVALVEGYKQTCDERYIIMAQQLANQALEQFYDNGRWLFSRGEFETEADTRDSSYPGEVGVMIDLLLSVGSIIDEKYRRFAFKSLEYYSFDVSKKPLHFPYMSHQMLRYVLGDRIIKASHDKLLEANQALNTITYPFVLSYAQKEQEHYLVCGDTSCFANTDDAKELNILIQNSF